MKWLVSVRLNGRMACSWLLLVLCIAAFLAALLLPLNALGLTAEETALQKAFEDGQIIRLHILAEDDSPQAQQLKLAVRDAVLAAFGQELMQAGTQDADAVYALLEARQDAMLAVATETARQHGYHGAVNAQVGELALPEKAYGSITLPAGEYRALRITIGSGQGQNWWCVLFPQLCLAVASDAPWQVHSQQAATLLDMEWHSLDILRHWLAVPLE